MEVSNFKNILTEKGYYALLNRLESNNHIFQEFFPIENTDKLTFETIDEVAGINVAAFTGAYGGAAKEVKYNDIITMRGDIPPISIKRMLGEKVIILLEGLTDRKKALIVGKIYDNLNFVKNACLTRIDYYMMRLMSNKGVINLNSDTNAGHIVDTIDYLLETWQKPTLTGAALWSASATADPVANIKTWQKARKNKGYNTKYILMEDTAFNAFAACEKVIAQSTYSVGNTAVKSGIVTLDAINIILKGARLPEIRIVEDNINYVKADGTWDYTARAWNTDNVSLISDIKQGVTLNAPTAEMLVKNKAVFTGISDGVTIQQYGIPDPVQDITKAKLNAMIAWSASRAILTAKVL